MPLIKPNFFKVRTTSLSMDGRDFSTGKIKIIRMNTLNSLRMNLSTMQNAYSAMTWLSWEAPRLVTLYVRQLVREERCQQLYFYRFLSILEHNGDQERRWCVRKRGVGATDGKHPKSFPFHLWYGVASSTCCNNLLWWQSADTHLEDASGHLSAKTRYRFNVFLCKAFTTGDNPRQFVS